MNFAMIPLKNSTALCIGGITEAESEEARARGVQTDGLGFHLFIAREATPQEPIRVLARFATMEAAEAAAAGFPHRE